jgi:hypothetical protein
MGRADREKLGRRGFAEGYDEGYDKFKAGVMLKHTHEYAFHSLKNKRKQEGSNINK